MFLGRPLTPGVWPVVQPRSTNSFADDKTGDMPGTGRIKLWNDRQRQSEPNPRRWLISAGLAVMVAVVTAALAVEAHGISHYHGPPWWAYLIFTAVAVVGVVRSLYKAFRDRRRLAITT